MKISKDGWERMRMLATITIQPHVKRRMTPQSLLPLPWESGKAARPQADELTPEQRLSRFEELAATI